MITKRTIQNLVKVAQALEDKNLYHQSDVIVDIMVKLAQWGGPHNYDQIPHGWDWKEIEEPILEQDKGRQRLPRLQQVPKPGGVQYHTPVDADDRDDNSMFNMNNPDENTTETDMSVVSPQRVEPYDETHNNSDPGNYQRYLPHG